MKQLEKFSELYHRLLYLNSKADMPEGMKSFNSFNELDQKIMNILFEHNSLTITGLNKFLKKSKSTLTSSIKRLEKKGVILRQQSLKDKRFFELKLTAKGIGMQESHHKFEDILFTGILSALDDDNERQALINMLEKIIEKFENNKII